MIKMTKTSIKKNFILSMFFQILNIITPLITAPYISRVLGANAVGIYSYTSSIQLYFSIFAALGTATYGCREIAINRDSRADRSKLFWEIELLTVFTSCICLLLYGVLICFSKDYSIYLIILGIKLINTMLDISWFFIGIEELKYVVYKNAFFKILGIILLFLLIKDQNDLILYIIIMCGTTLLGTLTMWAYVPKFVNKIKYKTLNIFKHFKYTIVYFIPTIATTIYSNIDKTLIGLITKDMFESAYYEQTTKILELAKSITFVSLNTLLTSRMSYLFAEDKIDEMKEKINISINYIMFIGIGIVFGIIGISGRFVPLFFGNGYDKVILLLKIFIFVILVTGISNCLETQYYTPSGQRKISTRFIIFGALVNLVLNCLLIPFFSSLGAIIASIFAEILIMYLYIKNCNGFISFINIIKIIWKKIVSGIVMLFIIFIINNSIVNDIYALIFEILFGGLTYILVLCLLGDSFIKDYLIKYFFQLKSKIIEKLSIK